MGDEEESWGNPEEEEEEAIKCGEQGLGRGEVLATVCLPNPHLLSDSSGPCRPPAEALVVLVHLALGKAYQERI